MVTISQPDQRAVRGRPTVKCNSYYFPFFFFLKIFFLSHKPKELRPHLPDSPPPLFCAVLMKIFSESHALTRRKWIGGFL